MGEARPLRLSHQADLPARADAHRDEPLKVRAALSELRVEWVASTSDIPLDVWRGCFPAPLEGLWLYEALERGGLDEQFSFAYALIIRDETIIAVAPVFTAVLPISLIVPDIIDRLIGLGGRLLRPLRFQKTLFVGSPCSDEGGWGWRPA